MAYKPFPFVDKYLLARQTTQQNQPQGGLCGFELEWNLLDSNFHPLLTVGSGPSQQSFVDFLRTECLSPWMREYSQLEVFHWMIEWATRPYYTPRGAVYEARLMEAFLLNALQKAGRHFNERLYYWYGNLPFTTSVSHASIPGSWHIAKRRYLERCVDLYGESLATAGTHANLSLPNSLFTWDFMHLPPSERGLGQNHNLPSYLDDYKSQFYITATRLMRAFAVLFIATSASTPLKATRTDGKSTIQLTDHDSVRNLTFPNPAALDLPDLYRSYNDYLQLSYDLVMRGIRIGNNNWTPVRARSFAEPVERLIAVTSDQLHDLYARGLYSVGQNQTVEETARQIEIQNLMARINIPMSRVEVRTDDGGHPLETDIANLTLKHLLLIRFYADLDFARSFRYDREDIARARRNEGLAALHGLRAEIENPLTGKPTSIREFLSWTLTELQPMAQSLDLQDDLIPLIEMSSGGPNTAERLRSRLRKEFGITDEVPQDVLHALAEERENQVKKDVEHIAETYRDISRMTLTGDSTKIGDFLQRARDDVYHDPQAGIRFRPRPEAILQISYPDKTSEILDLAQQLVRIPSVTACPEERLEEVHRAATFIFDYLHNYGLTVRYFDQGKYPAIVAGFPDAVYMPVTLSGHFDVVAPDPDDHQFEPCIEGDYLWGRGAADMKTVVATNMVWMKDILRQGPPYPKLNALLVGNEENGEAEPMGTPHVLQQLAAEHSVAGGDPYAPGLLIAGERTGERGDELSGEVCTQNRGIMRFDIIAHAARGHSGTGGKGIDLTEYLLLARDDINAIFKQALTLQSTDGWQSQVRYPFIQVGTQGIYNLTPDHAILGVEIRPIPQDELGPLKDELLQYCTSKELELQVHVIENGVACHTDNQYLNLLLQAITQSTGQPPMIGRKLPATSARFAPAGQGIVWGQTGIGPHSNAERHYIPSILPYYQSLSAFGDLLRR